MRRLELSGAVLERDLRGGFWEHYPEDICRADTVAFRPTLTVSFQGFRVYLEVR